MSFVMVFSFIFVGGVFWRWVSSVSMGQVGSLLWFFVLFFLVPAFGLFCCCGF